MIKEALKADGVEEIFKLGDDHSGETDLFDDDYLSKIEKIKLPNTKIKLLQQLLAKAITDFKKTNKAKGLDFSKKFKALVDLYNERKEADVFSSHLWEDFADDIVNQFTNLYEDIKKERSSGEELGVSIEEKAFYDILKSIRKRYDFEYPEDKLIALAKAMKAAVDDKAKYVDWEKREDIKAELKVAVILLLKEHGYPPITQDEVYKEILEQAENFKKNRTVWHK